MKLKAAFSFVLLVVVTSCSNPGIIQISPGTYEISHSSAAGAFANTAKMKAEVLQEANAFAEKQGKVAVPLSISENRPPVGFPTCDLQFTVMTLSDYNRQQQARIKDWNSLTPSQRAEIQLKQSEIALRSQEIGAYNQRTRALSQPVQVNVNGNVTHNLTGQVDVYRH